MVVEPIFEKIDPYQDNWINSTLVTHYELICDRTSLVKNAKSFQMAGIDHYKIYVIRSMSNNYELETILMIFERFLCWSN